MLRKFSGYVLALIGLTTIFTSCKKEYESVQDADSKKITEFIAKNNLVGMIKDPAGTGYYYQIVQQGTGDFLKNTDSVLYDGVLKGMENGVTYLSTPSYANLGTYVGYAGTLGYQTRNYSIPAIREVMLKLQRGGVAKILLPSHLAFGKNGAGEVSSNENIELTITTYLESSQAALDERLIRAFIAKNNLNMTRDPSGVWFSVSTPGTGTSPNINSNIKTTYSGSYTDGTVFESNENVPFDLNRVIAGWGKVIPGNVATGGKMRMLIPSHLGYGPAGTQDIPPNAILDFTVEILEVKD